MSHFLNDTLDAAIRREVITDVPEELDYCAACRWLFNRAPGDRYLCGTCSREQGFEPRDALTDEIDKRVREYQRCMSSR